MDNPCKNCDKANINKPTVLKCWKPCNKGKQYYECEKALIDILTGKPIGIDRKGGIECSHRQQSIAYQGGNTSGKQ